ncbi:DEAD/DEAH box helicase family protein [Staphylococcus agnetis]|uniref:DEAD/DEAH box helicase family protein n=1 Tax=Staphylococcus agnetis TaxID=985762 RepID=UPI00208F8753|nr:DEAD/DEAH box helicase family protein [Staphylococcus agnetis]MCO4357287.1 DEAD/DEAH box helicase family protein [Staphylococcus agnetis]MCO4363270.1 DEAD/DEAH box helicase family protein [Staphylococcus agnetis]
MATNFQLYEYQQSLVDNARLQLAKHSGVLIQSPPGSGKSVMIAEIVKLATEKGNRVLFIVHRKELIEQIKNTLTRHNVDLTLVDVYSEKRAKNNLSNLTAPQIILTDETHHSRAKTYTEIYEYFSDAWRVGFTATPWRANGKGFTDIYPEIVKGPTVEWLIENNKLAPYKYKSIALVDSSKLRKSSTGDYTKKSMDEAVPKAIYGDIVSSYRKFANGQKTILYAHSVEASKLIADKFNLYGITAVHADAKTPKLERESIMQDFRNNKIKVLCNVDLISEGFDVPDCTCVILARPTDSLVLYMQQSMRSMRYQPGKVATIIDHVGNYTRHNLPDFEHNWDEHFKGTEKKKKRKSKGDVEVGLKNCDECYTVYESNLKFCPNCGHENEVIKEELKNVEAELIDIKPFKVDYTLQKYSRDNKDKSELETLEDYYLYVKANNYKETWIKFNNPNYYNAPFPKLYADLKPIKQKYGY